MKFCPECGSNNEDDFKYCKNCGSILEKKPKNELLNSNIKFTSQFIQQRVRYLGYVILLWGIIHCFISGNVGIGLGVAIIIVGSVLIFSRNYKMLLFTAVMLFFVGFTQLITHIILAGIVNLLLIVYFFYYYRKYSRSLLDQKKDKINPFICISSTIIIFLIIFLTFSVFINYSTNLNQSNLFSDGSISFNYPGNLKNSSAPEQIISGDVSWVDVIYLHNSVTSIGVQKNPSLDENIEVIRRDSDESIKNSPGQVSTGEVLSQTTETNPNGVKIAKSITTLKDPDNNQILKYIDFYFKDNRGVVYSITIYGYESTYKETQKVSEIIFNSLKI